MATELETATEQLANVRTAINAVLTGHQSGSVAGRSWTRADLKELREMERDLVAKIARLGRGGTRVQRVIPL